MNEQNWTMMPTKRHFFHIFSCDELLRRLRSWSACTVSTHCKWKLIGTASQESLRRLLKNLMQFEDASHLFTMQEAPSQWTHFFTKDCGVDPSLPFSIVASSEQCPAHIPSKHCLEWSLFAAALWSDYLSQSVFWKDQTSFGWQLDEAWFQKQKQHLYFEAIVQMKPLSCIQCLGGIHIGLNNTLLNLLKTKVWWGWGTKIDMAKQNKHEGQVPTLQTIIYIGCRVRLYNMLYRAPPSSPRLQVQNH